MFTVYCVRVFFAEDGVQELRIWFRRYSLSGPQKEETITETGFVHLGKTSIEKNVFFRGGGVLPPSPQNRRARRTCAGDQSKFGETKELVDRKTY